MFTCVGCRGISINITICILHNVYSVVDGITTLSFSCEGYSPDHTAEQNKMLLHRMHQANMSSDIAINTLRAYMSLPFFHSTLASFPTVLNFTIIL